MKTWKLENLIPTGVFCCVLFFNKNCALCEPGTAASSPPGVIGTHMPGQLTFNMFFMSQQVFWIRIRIDPYKNLTSWSETVVFEMRIRIQGLKFLNLDPHGSAFDWHPGFNPHWYFGRIRIRMKWMLIPRPHDHVSNIWKIARSWLFSVRRLYCRRRSFRAQCTL